MLEKLANDKDAAVVGLTYDVRRALNVLGRAMQRNPAMFKEFVKRGVPARLLLSQMLEIMLTNKREELEIMKASLEFVKSTGEDIRREREAKDEQATAASVGVSDIA